MIDLFVDGFKNKEKYKKVIISIEQHNNKLMIMNFMKN
jgi:hypothetical protein